MIEQFQIFGDSGEVFFRYQLRRVPESVVNSFISTLLVSQRQDLVGINNGENDEDSDDIDEDELVNTFNGGGYSFKYIRMSNPGLVFMLTYPSVIHLHNTEEFLLKVKTLFVELFQDDLMANKSGPMIDFESEEFAKFEKFFEIQLNQYNLNNSKAEQNKSVESTTVSTSPSPMGRTPKNQQLVKKAKKSRKWGADGSIVEDFDNDGDSTALDFSASLTPAQEGQSSKKLQQLVGDQSNFGNKTKSGDFLVKDLGEEMDRILSQSNKLKKSSSTANEDTKSQPFGFLRNYLGGKKITKEDINQVSQMLSNHLINKNVAPEVARNLVSKVEKDLVGSTTKSFTSLDQTAKEALTNALTTLLTPNTSIDLLNEIQQKRRRNQPYVISVVGVNGVGKSTNLSKLAFWLLQNNYRVLITACDTFRSGAVEQLRVHVNNLKELSSDSDVPSVELFEGGYGGADLVSKIAKGAIKYAEENDFDIVLMDTAGRRHNDTKLMAPLLSFAKAANPDKIIMVGEALVGTDSVMQLQNFNKLFGVGRKLDCFIISKCDTVGDLIGSMVNMVYATGIPILFVGTGQTYTDLRTLSVDWAVNMLMS